MATHREANNPTFSYVEPMPWPKDVPKVDEVGATSAPLKSIAFFFGQFCQPYAEDFMLCKNENRDPEHCLKEGRRVTRCAQDLYVYTYKLTGSIQKIGEKCGNEWDAHWQCLEKNNQVRMHAHTHTHTHTHFLALSYTIVRNICLVVHSSAHSTSVCLSNLYVFYFLHSSVPNSPEPH